ncbi:hypothetical protein EDEG_00157 [Edhazardia aedis USNM 41457]|uniref:Uncharacterized protein n=1 Tax=Edhazardia aedis (strain USNM 41457) TaxID=1003232 RepID=J9D8Z9_EDHAE|nr:hypothetical protein EDEG_00157 [Edhazardia aedis USNM 41457]|eukprot:EJW04241.1 hypothetical protein EDEG_00157 [Edhazardia aedis USNM 41457]
MDEDKALAQPFIVTTVQRPHQVNVSFHDLVKHLCTLETKNNLTYFLTHLPLFGDVNQPTDINVFKKGISPLWEDEQNIKGCKFLIKVKKQVAQRLFERLVVYFTLFSDKANDIYENVFPEFLEKVNGVVASIRGKQVILSVWVRDTENVQERVLDIRKILNVNYDLMIEFKNNDDSIRDASSFRNTEVFGPNSNANENENSKLEDHTKLTQM